MRLVRLAVVLTFSLIFAPLAAEAQTAGKVYRVGLIAITLGGTIMSNPTYPWHSFFREMRDRPGWGVALAADANLRLVQAPSRRREIDLGETRPSDSTRCRQAKEDVKVLDGRLNGPEFADIPTRAEYDLGYGWERPGAGALFQSSGPTGRERTLETWGENGRQFKEGEAASEKYKDFNRRAPRTFSKPDVPSGGGSLTDYRRRLDEWSKAPSFTYATPESERLWKLYSQRINIQDTRRRVYDTMLSICYPTPNPFQDLEDRVRKLEEMPR